MITNTEVREKLNTVLKEQGIKMVFMAKQLGWNYENLVAFKNGKREYSEKRLKKLDIYLNRFDWGN